MGLSLFSFSKSELVIDEVVNVNIARLLTDDAWTFDHWNSYVQSFDSLFMASQGAVSLGAISHGWHD